MKSLPSFCTSDPRKNTFSKAHADDLESLLDKWGKWVGEHGNKHQIMFILFAEVWLFFLGVGSIVANERGSDDGSNEPEERADSWVQLLNKDEEGVYSLRAWGEVKDATKEDLGRAMREYMRQAWSK